MTTGIAALDAEIDKQESDTSILDDNNVVSDMVTVANGNIIGNGPQAVLGTLALATGYMYPDERNVNVVYTGPSATGKSKVQQGGPQAMLPMDDAYQITDASSKGVLDDGRWDEALFAPLDEWQKVPDELTELLKSLSGGADDAYRYARNVAKDDGDGRTTEEIVKKAKPYQFLYAQHAMDHELSTRLLFLPVDNNVHIRDAIIEKEGNATEVTVEGYNKEFVFDTTERERALRQHIRDLPRMTETLPGGDENARGGVDGYLPAWIRKSVKPIFDKNRTETNRVAGQIFNLIRASAVVNHHVRDTTVVEYDDREMPAYIASPQDVANILSTRMTLLSKTHHLTKVKLEILDAIRSHQYFDEGDSEGVGVTVDTIRNYLEDSSSLSVPRKQKLRDLLRELEEQFYLKIHERAGPNGAHLYEFTSLRDIGMPRLHDLDAYMDGDEIAECERHCPTVDLSDPFSDTTDPFRGQSFIETVDAMRDELSNNPVERAAETANKVAEAKASGAGGDDDTDGADGDGQATLSGADAMGSDDIGTPSGPVERVVYDRLQTHADDEIWSIDNVEDLHLIGVVDKDVAVTATDLTDTLVDPDHEVWDQPTKPDDWITSEGKAQSEIEQAITALENKGLLRFDVEGEPDGFVSTHVRSDDT